jgi:streptomycin 6-kinase
LKISQHVRETRPEIEALRIWDGVGAARLLAAEPDVGALLLERVQPGTMLSEIGDDDQTVRVAAALLRQLWQPPPEGARLPSLQDWTAAYDRNYEMLSRGAGGFPSALFERAWALRAELLASTTSRVVLHGDLHHFNILRSERAGWLAIDPKGLVGDRCFDVCQFLHNPMPNPIPVHTNRRRLDIFAAELDLDRRRLTNWSVVHAVLNACWNYEEGLPFASALAFAEQAQSF